MHINSTKPDFPKPGDLKFGTRHYVLRSCVAQIYSGMFLLYNFSYKPPNEIKFSGIMYLRILDIPTKFHGFWIHEKNNIEKKHLRINLG